jgi:hypothetical protein|tara:strand:- start:111 stop:365 length:255 start_codon:yes stop_codon:yes gene_type:complete
MDVREEVAEVNFEAMFADGFDDAVIGVDTYGRVVYDYDKCVDILMEEDDDLEYIDAIEYMDYNVTGAYVGEYTPIFIRKIENLN